jgi:hypothetical protein
MKAISTSRVCLIVIGLALFCGPDVQASDQPDFQSPIILAQAGGGSGGDGGSSFFSISSVRYS